MSFVNRRIKMPCGGYYRLSLGDGGHSFVNYYDMCGSLVYTINIVTGDATLHLQAHYNDSYYDKVVLDWKSKIIVQP